MQTIKVSRKVNRIEYRKFLYLAMFHRNRWLLVYLFLLSLIGGYFISRKPEGFSISLFFFSTAILFLLVVAMMVLRYERRNIKHSGLKKDEFYNIVHNVSFYEDKVSVSVEDKKEKKSFRYSDILMVLEGRTMMVIFFGNTFATYLSKKDMGEREYGEVVQILKRKIKEKYRKVYSIV